jgi:hypothetical protein
MGLYYTTYLCNGKFNNINESQIENEFQITTIDPIVEKKEWNKNIVDIKEITSFLGKHYKNIQLNYSKDTDLFLAEHESSTLSNPPMTIVKYILISKNYMFINYDNIKS